MPKIDCNNCTRKEQPRCCHAKPSDVVNWQNDVAKQEAKRQQQDNQSMTYGLLTGIKRR